MMQLNTGGKVLAGILVLLLISIIPHAPAEFVGGVQDSVTVYQDGYFGPSIEKVNLNTGSDIQAHTYVTRYPWYYFKDDSGDLHSTMEVINVQGGHSSWVQSDTLYVTMRDNYEAFPVTMTHKNYLVVEGDLFGRDGPQVCEQMRVAMYEGKITGDLEHQGIVKFKDIVGPFEYGDTWESDLLINPIYYSDYGTYQYTIQESMTIDWLPLDRILDTDRIWLEISVLKPEDEAQQDGSGQITVNVWDDRVPIDAYVKMYKDGSYVDTYFVSGGQRVFDNLEFARYRFEVVNNENFETQFYDAAPYQSDYDYNIGEIELSARLNTINYVVWGDDISTDDDPYGSRETGVDYDEVAENIANNTIVKIVTGDSGDGSALLDLIVKLLGSMGLMAIVILGLPLFLVLGVILLLMGIVFFGVVKDGN